jgi:(2Fe-2S) ferredoxin
MPDQPSRRTRIVVCVGQHCNRDGRAGEFCSLLQTALGDSAPAFMARGPVSWEIANCLNHCELGPNLALYPEGQVIHHLDREALEQVIADLTAPPEE